ncbi:DUF4276 family protein [candidate division KSB1 bacterium]|nr:DUF4276 family protein [candidate division KSB1 bacterium]
MSVVEHVEVLVEEPSMEAVLQVLLPRLLGQISFQVYPHSCKEELLARLPERWRGYRQWLPENWKIAVVVDRDDDDCRELKERLNQMADQAGLLTRSTRRDHDYVVIHRLAIEELEAWYFGDWEAVRAAYPRVSKNIPRKESYRNPDAIRGGTWEAFERILQRAGYFIGGLRKIEAARQIAPHLDPERNISKSFQVFRDALREVTKL